jgi:Protein of unknown function (DUF2591)
MKVAELVGPVLDWAVARALGKRPSMFIVKQTGALTKEHRYSTDWAEGGPIIEREWICADRMLGGLWVACKRTNQGDSMLHLQAGPTPLIAAMRCYVASKLGDNIDIPKELQ